MNIPDEAVEAADRVFNDLFEIGQSFGPDSIREMLEAAAPYIAAEVWDEGWGAPGYATNPYRSQA